MKLSWEVFQEHYKKAPDEIRILIESDRLSGFARALVEKLELPESMIPACIRVLDARVLGIVTEDTLPKHLQYETGMPEDINLVATGQIESFVSHVVPPEFNATGKKVEVESERTPAEAAHTPDRLHLKPEYDQIPDSPDWESAAPQPITHDHIAASLATKRTMASDIAAMQKEAPKETESPASVPTVPRYAKPLTAIPRYGDRES